MTGVTDFADVGGAAAAAAGLGEPTTTGGAHGSAADTSDAGEMEP